MLKRYSTRELIQESVRELLMSDRIEKITVNSIAENCGITTRTFYYHFSDKHAVVSSIYLEEMQQFFDCSLTEWYGHQVDYTNANAQFFKNTLCYLGQNNLGDTIVDLDFKKLQTHIKKEVREDERSLKRVELGIDYFLQGNLGLLRHFYYDTVVRNKFTDATEKSTYNGLVDWYESNWPPIVRNNLSENPIGDCQNNLFSLH